jgi:hypothetical protein
MRGLSFRYTFDKVDTYLFHCIKQNKGYGRWLLTIGLTSLTWVRAQIPISSVQVQTRTDGWGNRRSSFLYYCLWWSPLLCLVVVVKGKSDETLLDKNRLNKKYHLDRTGQKFTIFDSLTNMIVLLYKWSLFTEFIAIFCKMSYDKKWFGFKFIYGVLKDPTPQ